MFNLFEWIESANSSPKANKTDEPVFRLLADIEAKGRYEEAHLKTKGKDSVLKFKKAILHIEVEKYT